MTGNLHGNIRGFLFDLDGTVYIGDNPIPGAVETIQKLKHTGFTCRFLTNTTVRSIGSLHKKITGLGLPVELDEIITPTRNAITYLRNKGNPSCHFLLTDDPLTDFEEFTRNDIDPDCVLVGDMAKSWNWEMINRVFNMILNGSELLALHKGRFWQTDEGLRIDIGAFVAGLEYATGKEAIVFGKPSRIFFNMALESIGLPAEKVAMIGDDIISDIGGAQQCGIKGILVKTGKYREDFAARSGVTPDLVIDSVAELQNLVTTR